VFRTKKGILQFPVFSVLQNEISYQRTIHAIICIEQVHKILIMNLLT